MDNFTKRFDNEVKEKIEKGVEKSQAIEEALNEVYPDPGFTDLFTNLNTKEKEG